MFNRITFYFHQASSNLKRSILIILSISIAISMVAGALYYSNSFEETALHDGFNNITDISVNPYYLGVNFSSELTNQFPQISFGVNQSSLNVLSTFEYGFLDTGFCYFYRNFSNGSTSENMSLNAFIADDNFYKTDEFSHYFTLYEGKLPTNHSEILMDITALNHFNYHVGEKVNLTLYFGSSSAMYLNYTTNELTISGAYYSNILHYSIMNQNYVESYNNNNKNFYPSPIFSYENFSKQMDNNPFQQFSNFVLNSYNNPQLISHVGFQFGVGLDYNKNSIHFSNLKSTNQEISNQIHVLTRYIPFRDVTHSYINAELSNFIKTISGPLNSLFIFIVPFLIFALIIGSFSISNISSRFDEFLLLESKGTPKAMIRNQLLTETLLIGVISAILSISFGFLTYEIYEKVFGNVLFTNLNHVSPNIHLYISWSSFGLIILSCIGISLFTSIVGIRKMNKVQISELLSTMGDEGVTIEYDEETLFGKKTTADLSDSNDLNDEFQNVEINQIQKSERSIESSGIDAIDGNLKYYKDHIKKSQKKIPKVSYILVIISLFPLLFYYLGLKSLQPNAPDILLNFQSILSQHYFFFSILFIISPVLMAVGVMRFLSKESPSRYAKITRFLSKPFLKANSYLVSLEMIKRKKFRKILYIIGIFVSVLVFSNCIFNSISRYPIIENNLAIGGDLRLTANVQAKNHLYNTSYTQTVDNSLKNLTNDRGTPIINNILTYYKLKEASGQTVYYFNFTKYLQIIQEGGKFVPKNVLTELSIAIAYDNNTSNKYPGAIVDKAFLNYNHYEIGDLINITHTQYDPQTNQSIYTPFKAKIIAVYDELPGISFDQYGFLSQFQNSNNLAIDFRTFNQSSQLINTVTLNQLVDLNLKAESNQTIIQQSINSIKLDKITFSSYNFYNQQWNSPLPVGETTASGFYSLIYFEFIILGVILSLGLASILNSFQTSNRYFFGLLMSRGFGKGGIFRFMLSQLIILFFLAIVSGVIIGSITSTIFLKMTINVINPNLVSLGLPIFFSPIGIIEVLGIVLGVSFIAYIATYYIQMRKSLSQYMRKF